MKWKSLLKKIAIAGVEVAAPGPIGMAVDEIFSDKAVNNDEAMQLMAAAMDAMSKRMDVMGQRISTLERRRVEELSK